MKEKREIKMFDYFTIKELTAQNDGWEVTEAIRTGSFDCLLVLLCVLDNFRRFIQKPIKITSAYRSEIHNKQVGGSPTSQHLLGEAIDFMCTTQQNDETINQLKEFLEDTAFRDYLGQVIFYNTFIHIALCSEKHKKLTYYDKRTNQKRN